MTPTGNDPSLAVDRLRSAKRVLLTSHRNPDGDAIGSELALAELARSFGVEPVIVNRDQASVTLSELPGIRHREGQHVGHAIE